ncbi:FeoA family protein [Rossellomorea aquimaris]|uniref:FeoA family protein n=1 Tax=Rossellomorea aquimaris TaxID=189382 RepID=UPI0007D0A910|nr:FeoA family protein [Rossellomorea aquimaris]
MSESKNMLLSECKPGDEVLIKSLSLEGTMRRRLLDLGFVRGSELKVIQKSPLGDPMAFRVSDTTIALRKEESSKIIVEKIGGDE